MKLNRIAAESSANIWKLVNREINDETLKSIEQEVIHAMESALQAAHDEQVTVCRGCLEHDMDLAHKLQRDMEQRTQSLISNLNSLR